MGGGVLIALAAALWLVYLIPSWLRRREYLATERNAVRLQQTLRVLAETAEVPVAVRAETTARSVVQAQRELRRVQAADVASPQTIAARRRKRTRALSSMVLLGSLATIGVQLALIASSGIAAGAFAVLGAGGVGAVTSLGLLRRLAVLSRARGIVGERSQLRKTTSRERVEPVEIAWTPVPLPKPLYLSRAVIDHVVVEAEIAAAELRQAAAEAETRLRAAQATVPSIEPFERVELVETFEPVETPRRLATLDIDEVLRRRRRAAG